MRRLIVADLIRAVAIAAALTVVSLRAAYGADPQLNCLALAVYHEARGEEYQGQLAVAHVVLNRVNDPRFPSTPCSVIRQPRAFPWYGRLRVRDTEAYRRALVVAAIARRDRDGDPTFGALCFDQTRRPPPCRGSLAVRVIGGHRFYALPEQD